VNVVSTVVVTRRFLRPRSVLYSPRCWRRLENFRRGESMSFETITNDTGLNGKVAIVSGGGGPIGEGIANGRAAAVLLGRAGAKVVVVGRSPELAKYTVDMITAEGGTAVAHPADVTREADCRAVVAATIERFGRLDCLDNNVGMGHPGDITSLDLETWRKFFAINVESMVLMSKYAVPAMIETAKGGAIVNIGSMRAIRPFAQTVYSASKGAVMALTQAMAVDHGAQGIRVNCLVVGPVFTPSIGQRATPERRALRAKASILGIEGSGWDVGYAVRFLLSEQSRFLTGQCINLDGGISLIGPAR
jgi:NAD(P)-dependent dehydrogenase (short-subunit alcohol dehydrogenase family)